jgi:hypothetical protein
VLATLLIRLGSRASGHGFDARRRLWSSLTPRGSAGELAAGPRRIATPEGDSRRHSRHGSPRPTLGAERIRGELLKVGIKIEKRTIQKYMRGVHSTGSGGQT